MTKIVFGLFAAFVASVLAVSLWSRRVRNDDDDDSDENYTVGMTDYDDWYDD